jgi:protein O-GlcNAc transferase
VSPGAAADPAVAAGLALLRGGQALSALRYFRELADRAPNAAAWFYLGVSQQMLGRLADASASFEKAIELTPDAADAYAGLGMAKEGLGARAAAVAAYSRALELDDGHYAARLNRGVQLLEQADAEAALADFDRLAAAHPVVDVHTNRARALFALHRDEEALAAAHTALAIDPSSARARLDKAVALASLGRFAESSQALAAFRQAAGNRLREFVADDAAEQRLRPGALWMGRRLQEQQVCDWRQRDALVRELRTALSSAEGAATLDEPAFLQHALALPLSGQELRRLGELALRGARERGAALGAPLAAGKGAQRLRVGFLAASIRQHPESYLLRQVFLKRDRQHFEYFLYALNPGDGSAVRGELERSADRFTDLSRETSAAIVQRVRRDELDLLVDVSGAYHFTRPELLAARLAPTQAAFLATAASFGEGLHDYRVSDAWTTPPEAQAEWPERLVLLPAPHFTYDNSVAPAAAGERSGHGLPAAGLVFCGHHQPFKIEPDAFTLWTRILGACPQSVLWLLDAGRVANSNLRREAEARGIGPERLVFAPHRPLAEHIGRLAHADLFLDTFYCNAHTSALDALWAGVPVLTRVGATMASRLAATFVKAIGLEELIVDSNDAYEAKALELARDPVRLQALKGKLATNRERSPAFDTQARVRALERAFVAMVERQRTGLAPAAITID